MTSSRAAIPLLSALCLLVPSALASQNSRLQLEPRRLGSRIDTLAVYLIRGTDTVRTGSIVDQLRIERNRLVRVYATTDQVLGNGLDTIISSVDDLRPIAFMTRSASQIARLSFKDLEVTGWTRLPNGDSTDVRQPLPAVVYDGASFDLVIRASPLRDKFSLTVPAFLIGSNTVGTLTGSVSGTELVNNRPCWVFKANFAGMPVTFWIDKETRALRRQLMQPRADMGILFTNPSPTNASGRAT